VSEQRRAASIIRRGCPVSNVLANHLAGRFARFVPHRALASSFADPLTEDFLHKLLGMLNAWLWGRS
jgi:hypothetical protein